MRGFEIPSAAIAAFLLTGPFAAQAAGDVDAGKTAFTRRCGACHNVVAGQNKIGPSLHGIVGRPAGQVAGFNYSPAMRDSGRTWDAPTLDTYLENPRDFVVGTRMILAGIKDGGERENIIAYLAEQK